MCHCDNTGWNGHRIRVSTENQLWIKKPLPPLPPGLEPATFGSRVWHSINELSRIFFMQQMKSSGDTAMLVRSWPLKTRKNRIKKLAQGVRDTHVRRASLVYDVTDRWSDTKWQRSRPCFINQLNFFFAQSAWVFKFSFLSIGPSRLLYFGARLRQQFCSAMVRIWPKSNCTLW